MDQNVFILIYSWIFSRSLQDLTKILKIKTWMFSSQEKSSRWTQFFRLYIHFVWSENEDLKAQDEFKPNIGASESSTRWITRYIYRIVIFLHFIHFNIMFLTSLTFKNEIRRNADLFKGLNVCLLYLWSLYLLVDLSTPCRLKSHFILLFVNLKIIKQSSQTHVLTISCISY